MKVLFFISVLGLMVSCGKEITDNKSSELNTSLDSSECKSTMEDYSGCCSSHGGGIYMWSEYLQVLNC